MMTDPFVIERSQIEVKNPIATTTVRGVSSWLSVLPGDDTDTRRTDKHSLKKTLLTSSHACIVSF